MRVAWAQRGVTLVELMVAMLLLAMVTSMLYSVLNVGIKFSRKGEDRLNAIEVERSFLEVLHRQVNGVWYDKRNKKIRISIDGNILKMITSSSLLTPYAGMVLAVYWYDHRDRALYYAEKLDFYNIDYDDNYLPSDDEMVVLLRDIDDPDWRFDESEGILSFSYQDNDYEVTPRVWLSEAAP